MTEKPGMMSYFDAAEVRTATGMTTAVDMGHYQGYRCRLRPSDRRPRRDSRWNRWQCQSRCHGLARHRSNGTAAKIVTPRAATWNKFGADWFDGVAIARMRR